MSGRRDNSIKFAIALIVAFAFWLALPSTTCAQEKAYTQKKKGKYGTVKILSTPGGLPLEVDGKSYGLTTTDFRSIDLNPGLHRIVIILPSGNLWTREVELGANRIKCLTVNYRAGIAPPPVVSCPFPVNISAPTLVSEGEVITYKTNVAYNGSSPLRYTWKVSPGKARILSGAGTSTITVDSTGLDGQRITASVVVDDGSGDAACSQTVQASTFIPASPAREIAAKHFDVCRNCSFDDQKARLDNLAVELQNDPSTSGYIISYAGRTSPVNRANQLGARARDYIVTKRGVDSARIVMMNGGLREDDSVDLWVVPAGAKPPQAQPTVEAGIKTPARVAPPAGLPRGQD
jgi:hypothetical protein